MFNLFKNPYRYFISYSHCNKNGWGFGSIEIHLKKPVKSMDDIKIFIRLLEDEGMKNVVILNYQLL